jgi:aspartyl-tRNA(Asn)/glutamyl-tRNA(Gln) amidotransferase subunit B
MNIPAGWEVVIGLETHAQLSTNSKIFSASPTQFGASPNTQANAVDLALPGTLPVLNRGAVERAIRFGLAVGGQIASRSIFARKNYFYPDLPKGYQISQFELPVVVGGHVQIVVDGMEKSVQLTRAHLEEDAGKSLHEGLESAGVSGIDLNRAGTPLLEIVTEPVMRSAAEAVAYAKALHGIVTWIGICDGNMQEGSFRCDANVSVRRQGDPKLGTRAEIKNVNSFRFLERAIEYEIRRQIEVIEDGGKVVQETRLYDADRDETRSMRSKEDAMDYRYFPDPDLLPLVISQEWIAEVKASMPEMPDAMAQRFVNDFGLSEYDARLLTQTKAMVDFFVPCVQITGDAKATANWILGELSAIMNREGVPIEYCQVGPEQLAQVITLQKKQMINGSQAKQLLAEMWGRNKRATLDLAEVLMRELGLEQVSDAGAIEKMVDDVIAANPKSVEEYRAGKEKALNALFGQVMKASNKTANPAQVTEILKRKLAS